MHYFQSFELTYSALQTAVSLSPRYCQSILYACYYLVDIGASISTYTYAPNVRFYSTLNITTQVITTEIAVITKITPK